MKTVITETVGRLLKIPAGVYASRDSLFQPDRCFIAE